MNSLSDNKFTAVTVQGKTITIDAPIGLAAIDTGTALIGAPTAHALCCKYLGPSAWLHGTFQRVAMLIRIPSVSVRTVG
jgi:hypothetical protein